MPTKKRGATVLAAALLICSLSACYKNDIQFGDNLGETYTRLLQIDTVGIQMSTYFLDSFATNNKEPFLAGTYKDSVLGLISAQPFLQLATPGAQDLGADAVYDSLTFTIKWNKYYYGDTTGMPTVRIHELSDAIDYTYGTQIFNTNTVAHYPAPLGTQTLRMLPSRGDSVRVRLSDAKGRALFNLFKEKAAVLSSQADFVHYFKGVTIDFESAGALYGFNPSADSLFMRLHYHSSIPYPQSHTLNFPLDSTGMFFNRVVADRSNTPLQSLVGGKTEVPSAATGSRSYMQSSTGVLLKLTFPSLRNILQESTTMKLLKATLVLKAPIGTYDDYRYKLPSALFLAQTDGSNTIGDFLTTSSGESLVYSTPVTDPFYATAASYSFDVTSYINTLLTTSGTADYGFFVLASTPGTISQVDRMVVDNTKNTAGSSKLVLSVLTIKN